MTLFLDKFPSRYFQLDSRCGLSLLEHLHRALQGLVNVVDVGGVALEGKVHQGRVQSHNVVQWHVITTLTRGRRRKGWGQ